jgi:hypothetical protein
MHPPTATEKPDPRAVLAITILLLSCALSTGRLLLKTPGPRQLSDPNQVEQRSDARFTTLKSALPKYGVVGYVGAPGAAAQGDYYLAQYALAPLVVDHSPDHRLVIGNFPPGAAPTLPPNLQLIKNFGDGVLLFSSKDAE